MNISHLSKPVLTSVPLATGLNWRGGNSSGFLFQEKSDGKHEFAEFAGGIFNAERLPSGELVVNDLVSLHGQDLRCEPTRTRWGELLALAPLFTHHASRIRLSRTGAGGEFLEHLLREGGEGVVAKPLDAPFGANWYKCKRSQVFICRVMSLDHARGSVELADAATGQPHGKLPLRSKFDHIRLGSILKVEAFGAHPSGLLREARLDHDTPTSWLVQF